MTVAFLCVYVCSLYVIWMQPISLKFVPVLIISLKYENSISSIELFCKILSFSFLKLQNK